MTIDLEGFFRTKIDSMLIPLSWVDEIRKAIGIEGAHQVWGDKPAWYLWISGAPGVYDIELVETDTSKQEGIELLQGAFSLRCYPFTHSPTFKTLSFEEQCLLESKFFDQTNTPVFEYREEIPQNLFTVGIIECGFDSDEGIAYFTFESLDNSRISFQKEMILNYPLINKSKRFRKGEADRQVRGTEVGYVFFDKLLCIFSFSRKKMPKRVLNLRSSGFEYVYDQSNALACVDSEEIKVNTISVLYDITDEGTAYNQIEQLGNQFKAKKEDIIYDQTFSSGDFRFERDEFRNMMPLNNKWWSLAQA